MKKTRVFLRVDLSFTLEHHRMEFPDVDAGLYGVTNLTWGRLSPTKHFGKPVHATLSFHSPKGKSIQVRGHLMREYGEQEEPSMGVRFELSDDEKMLMKNFVDRYGHAAPEYTRKFPRIPLDLKIGAFPTHALASPTHLNQPLVYEIRNLSPAGGFFCTQSQQSLSLVPGQVLDILINPRGSFPHAVALQGKVCRIIDEVDTQTRNIIRSIGVQFVRMDDVNRTVFKDLIKEILKHLAK